MQSISRSAVDAGDQRRNSRALAAVPGGSGTTDVIHDYYFAGDPRAFAILGRTLPLWNVPTGRVRPAPSGTMTRMRARPTRTPARRRGGPPRCVGDVAAADADGGRLRPGTQRVDHGVSRRPRFGPDHRRGQTAQRRRQGPAAARAATCRSPPRWRSRKYSRDDYVGYQRLLRPELRRPAPAGRHEPRRRRGGHLAAPGR